MSLGNIIIILFLQYDKINSTNYVILNVVGLSNEWSMEPLTVMIINEKMAWSHETNVPDYAFSNPNSNVVQPNTIRMPNCVFWAEKTGEHSPKLSDIMS